MTPDDLTETDDLKQAWLGQTHMKIDTDLLLKEVRRNAQSFAVMIFWRDFREVGAAVVMVPLWIYLGARNSSTWTWYLTIPVLVWIAGFMLVDRRRHQRQSSEGEPLRRHIESSLAEVEHQIGLLRSVHWWALLPMAVAMMAFFAQTAWRERGGGWWTVLAFSMVSIIGLGVLGGVYWVNLYAVRAMLEPRRRELKTLLTSFEDETPAECETV
jgi:hypothetical protein